MKDTTKALTLKKASLRSMSIRSVEEVVGKTTGASKSAPRRSAAQRETEEADGLSREADTIGIDVGDRVSQFCRLDASGEIAEQGKLHTNAAGFEKHFAKLS